MKIIQLTDLHLGREGEDTRGIDVRANFLKALEIIGGYKPDCLVISGDICYRAPELPIYEWFFDQMKDYPIPWEVIPGNHDDVGMMKQVFDLDGDIKTDGLYFSRNIAGEQILFLDTTPATMESPQLNWLKKQLENNPKDLIIFMHHPPLTGGVPYMDNNHAFKTSKKVQEILFRHPRNLTIFTGHYHVEKTLRIKNVEVNITPSTFFQISQESVEFAVDHQRPGFRVIEKNGEVLGHYVVYFDLNTLD
jgi:Icc protein